MRESYLVQPAEVESYAYDGHTDIILRQAIEQEKDDDGNDKWTCEERQMRLSGSISIAAIKADFSRYWALAGDEEPLADAKTRKTEEMSAACKNAIIEGFDVVLSDGDSYHFSLTIEDQLNINSLYGLLASGLTQIPYHADGESCKYFSTGDFQTVVQAATAHKTYHESYYNSLRAYITACENTAAVDAISYGVEIPEQYQSDVLKALLQTEE